MREHVIDWFFKYADLVSAAFGLASAIVLGWPAVLGVAAKRRYQGVETLTYMPGQDIETRNALEGVKRHAMRYQLGDPSGALVTNLWGYGLLAASFVFLGIASLSRIYGA